MKSFIIIYCLLILNVEGLIYKSQQNTSYVLESICVDSGNVTFLGHVKTAAQSLSEISGFSIYVFNNAVTSCSIGGLQLANDTSYSYYSIGPITGTFGKASVVTLNQDSTALYTTPLISLITHLILLMEGLQADVVTYIFQLSIDGINDPTYTSSPASSYCDALSIVNSLYALSMINTNNALTLSFNDMTGLNQMFPTISVSGGNAISTTSTYQNFPGPIYNICFYYNNIIRGVSVNGGSVYGSPQGTQSCVTQDYTLIGVCYILLTKTDVGLNFIPGARIVTCNSGVPSTSLEIGDTTYSYDKANGTFLRSLNINHGSWIDQITFNIR
jgi:hypothetical protein